MRRAGRVVGRAQGLAVLRAENDELPEIGEDVLDDELNVVGSVVDLFGPVEDPYIAVTPKSGIEAGGLLSQILYVR